MMSSLTPGARRGLILQLWRNLIKTRSGRALYDPFRFGKSSLQQINYRSGNHISISRASHNLSSLIPLKIIRRDQKVRCSIRNYCLDARRPIGMPHNLFINWNIKPIHAKCEGFTSRCIGITHEASKYLRWLSNPFCRNRSISKLHSISSNNMKLVEQRRILEIITEDARDVNRRRSSQKIGAYVMFNLPLCDYKLPSDTIFMDDSVIRSWYNEMQSKARQIDEFSKNIKTIFETCGSLPIFCHGNMIRINFPNLTIAEVERHLIDLGICSGLVYPDNTAIQITQEINESNFSLV